MKNRPGVIDTLSLGFSAITQQLWVLAIPVALDLYLWLGPRLSPIPLIQRASLYLPSTGLAIQLQELLAGFNLFSLLASAILAVPSLMAGATTVSPLGQMVIEIDDGLPFMGWVLALLPLGLLVGCLYLGLIAQKVREKPYRSLLHRIWGYWLRVILLLLIFIGGAILLGLPLAMGFTLVSLLSESLAPILSTLLLALLVWIWFYLFFAIDAIVISDAGPLSAIWNSINVVRRNFWSSLGLIILINVIGMGLSLVWRALGANPWGLALGIVGNAYVGSGLAAASLIFYRDRYTNWLEETSGSG
ncbi:MAG: hypothetical protein WBH57_07890 [Anaerolineae bacterium]